MSDPNAAPNDQAAADKDAADRREADLQVAADRRTEQRKVEDDAVAQQRLDEDTARADARREEDRVVASARGRVTVAAEALQRAVDSGNAADVRAANAELQASLQEHLGAEPEPVAPVKE
jgi:hypothetical protein